MTKVTQLRPKDDRVARDLTEVEMKIRDVERAAKIAFLMMMHDAENKHDEPLAMFAVEQTERLAGELREVFYSSIEGAQP